ncbi:receptor-like protein kinase [Tanacetum coccineum]
MSLGKIPLKDKTLEKFPQRHVRGDILPPLAPIPLDQINTWTYTLFAGDCRGGGRFAIEITPSFSPATFRGDRFPSDMSMAKGSEFTTTKTEDKVEGRLPLDIVISKLRVLPSSSCFPAEMRLCCNNGVTGDIPSGFSKLEMLEQLDASQPSYRNFSISLAELRVLAQINISYNLFTGDIPASLLNSSFYSFVGNPCLCVHCVLNNCDANLTRNLRRCKGAS